MRFLLAFLFSLVCCTTGLPYQSVAGKSVIARVGAAFITEEEFLQRFELLPGLYRHRKSQLQGAKVELLYSIVAEKLLAQEALQRHLDEDSLFQSSFLAVRKLLARDQLYRNEISSKVSLSPEEIIREMVNAQTLVHVGYLYFDSREDAEFVRALIASPSDFDKLEVDSGMSAFRDTATVIWGDAECAIEEAAYTLQPGDISPVVEARTGYYILRCINRSPNIGLTLEGEALRERALRRIRERREDVLMHRFIPTVLGVVPGYAKPGPFNLLVRSLIQVFEQRAITDPDTLLVFNKGMAAAVRDNTVASLQDTLAVAGNVAWKVADVIDRLIVKSFTVHRNRLLSIPRMLNDELEFWVHQEILGQEGLRRGLDQHPDMRSKVAMWRDAYLADMMKLYARQHVTVSDAEVWSYLLFKDTSTVIPRVELRELRLPDLEVMHSALADLEDGMSLEEVVIKWAAGNDGRNGLTSLFPVTERAPLGEIAAGMATGERYGPVRVGDEVILFEVVARDTLSVQTDELRERRFAEAKSELLSLKQQGVINKFLAQVARDRGVDVYTDRLLKLEVSPIPMLTFRYLGFGGRMFEVPFVDPQLQWLSTDPPDGTVLP